MPRIWEICWWFFRIFIYFYNIYFLCLPVDNCNPPARVCYILWWHPKHSRYVKDFLYNEQSEPLIWEDGESGRKCAVALLTQEARDRACGWMGFDSEPNQNLLISGSLSKSQFLNSYNWTMFYNYVKEPGTSQNGWRLHRHPRRKLVHGCFGCTMFVSCDCILVNISWIVSFHQCHISLMVFAWTYLCLWCQSVTFLEGCFVFSKEV